MEEKQQKTMRIFCLILLGALALTGLWILFDNTVDRSGWVQKDGIYSYRDFHGRPVIGWQTIEDTIYYFDEDAAMATHWQDIDGSRYYFGGDGVMATGWKNVGDIRCYFAPDGSLHTGWLELDEKRYYLEENGAMVSGWFTQDGETYYFGENGAMLTGWNRLNENTYLFEENGHLVTGYVTLDGDQYYFLEDGIMFTGWEDTEAGRRHYGEDGIRSIGWTEIDGKLYLLNQDGIMQTGWQQVGEYRYYLQEDGSAAVGPTQIDGELYHFTPKGIQVVLVNSSHYVPDYYNSDLVTYTGWHQVSRVALEPLTKMLEDLVAAGYKYEFNSAYRSIAAQKEILSLRTQEHIDRGYSPEEAYAEARSTVALPGTSEHHLGLAVDILNNKREEKQALDWLGEHCWEYGFILRYAEEKAHITGIIYEPWHFRYVGREVSMDMKDSGLCLEEYLGAA